MSVESDQPKKIVGERSPFILLKLPMASPFNIGETILIQTINEKNRRRELAKLQEEK
jgi:hypothetical protein